MSDYRNTLRLAREVDAIRTELDAVSSPDQVKDLETRVAALHVEVADALRAHTATRPWYTRWLWELRRWRFGRHAVTKAVR